MILNSASHSTIPGLVKHRAQLDGNAIAYTFLADGAGDAQSISWSQLDQRARELAARWCSLGIKGQPVLLGLASGLKFVESLMACWYAGAIAVPVSLPRHARVKHRLDGIVADAGAKFMVGLKETRQLLDAQSGTFSTGLTWLDPHEVVTGVPADVPEMATGSEIALLQYTSGSTGSPRGVVVTHANLMHNSALIAQACGHGPGQTIGGWLPLFHDMGLIGLLVQAAFSGARCVFMSPERFLMRPWLWLQMISDFNVCSSPAPNFAYDLCVDKVTPEQKTKLNLSGWRNALNGSEPVRDRTLNRFAQAFENCGFSKSAFFPCFGLAESTLVVTGPSGSSRRLITDASAGDSGRVGCGQPLGDTQLATVNPQTLQRVATGEVGEIWVAGASCAQGYWNDPTSTQRVFNARLDDAQSTQNSGHWLRTGDLGFIADGQLFITGRIRELIIIAGRNLFPVDLEQTAELAHEAIAMSGVAAFSVEFENTERLVIAAELRREAVKASQNVPDNIDLPAIRRQISAAVATEHGVMPFDIVLIRSGGLPRTTSGKLRRGTAREQYLNQSLTQITSLADISTDGTLSHTIVR